MGASAGSKPLGRGEGRLRQTNMMVESWRTGLQLLQIIWRVEILHKDMLQSMICQCLQFTFTKFQTDGWKHQKVTLSKETLDSLFQLDNRKQFYFQYPYVRRLGVQ